MTANTRTLLWISTSFGAALITAAATLAIFGDGTSGTQEALRITARLSFLLFWPAYAGGLFRRTNVPLLARVAKLRREFGLSFVAAHSIHVLLILWLFHIATHQPVSTRTIITDGFGILWMYVLGAFSFDYLRRKLSPQAWRVLFNLGLEYIALIFLRDFARLDRAHSPAYLPFTILLLIALIPRWVAGAYMIATWVRSSCARLRQTAPLGLPFSRKP